MPAHRTIEHVHTDIIFGAKCSIDPFALMRTCQQVYGCGRTIQPIRVVTRIFQIDTAFAKFYRGKIVHCTTDMSKHNKATLANPTAINKGLLRWACLHRVDSFIMALSFEMQPCRSKYHDFHGINIISINGYKHHGSRDLGY